jgi:hypothetical protein
MRCSGEAGVVDQVDSVTVAAGKCMPPCTETACMLFGPLLASGQITPRKVDGSNYGGDQSHVEDGHRQREDQHACSICVETSFGCIESSMSLCTATGG